MMDNPGNNTMSEQVHAVVNLDDLVEEISADLLLTEDVEIYKIVEGNEGDVLTASESDAIMSSVSFPIR